MPHSAEGLAEKVERAPEVSGSPWGQETRPGAPGISLGTSIREPQVLLLMASEPLRIPPSSLPSKPSCSSAWTVPPTTQALLSPSSPSALTVPGLDLPHSSLSSTWPPLGLLLSTSLWESPPVSGEYLRHGETQTLCFYKFFKVPVSDPKVSIQGSKCLVQITSNS